MSLLLLLSGAGSGGGPAPITLASGDLTTAWSKHLSGLTTVSPQNEQERATLTTAYVIDGGTDLTTVVRRFLNTRSAP